MKTKIIFMAILSYVTFSSASIKAASKIEVFATYATSDHNEAREMIESSLKRNADARCYNTYQVYATRVSSTQTDIVDDGYSPAGQVCNRDGCFWREATSWVKASASAYFTCE